MGLWQISLIFAMLEDVLANWTALKKSSYMTKKIDNQNSN